VNVYARLYSMINGAWQYNDYTYTEAGNPVPAVITSPTPGCALSSSSATFNWTAGGGVTEYKFLLGTTGPGSQDLDYLLSATALSSGLVTNLPNNGVTLYARLYSMIDGAWQHKDYTYWSGTPAPAAITSPTPGSTLPGASVTFIWSAGAGVTEYELRIGSWPGLSDFYNATDATTTATSAGVTLPTYGMTVYARLYSKINGAWQYTDSTYTESGTPTPAAITSPTPGSKLSGSSVTFTWSAGVGVTAYLLTIGNTGPGSSGLFYMASGAPWTSWTVTLPTYGMTVYVRLSSWINGAWQYNDYTYTEAGAPVPAAITSPAPGSKLSGSSATFNWTAGGGGVTEYEFRLGTTGPGSQDLDYLRSATALSSGLVNNLPTNGATLYARLYSKINGAWQHTDYTYIEAGTPVPAAITSPTPGSTLGASATFNWTAGAGVTKYEFRLGSTGPGSQDLDYLLSATALSSGLVNNLPTNGATLYARLYSLINGAWQHTDYTYIESGVNALAVISSPAPGYALSSSSATFNWTAGAGVTEYKFLLGTTGPGSQDLDYLLSATALSSGLVTNLPDSGVTLYARLCSMIGGAWFYKDYTYWSGTPAPAAITSPTPGGTLGASATFNWSAGAGVTEYELRIGNTGPGSNSLCNVPGAMTSLTVTLPTYGMTVYVRLYSLIDGAWQYNDYTYTESGTPVPAAITSPVPGSKLSGASATFSWSAGGGVTRYEFRLGTTGPGSQDLDYLLSATALSSGLLTNLPTYGVTLYARLYSLINGAWQYTDYTYTEAGAPVPAAITSPAPGSTLGASATFNWTAGAGVTEYEFRLGSTGPGSQDLDYLLSATALSSGPVNNLPTNGATLYARLYSLINGAWQHTDYVYTEQ
jgi:hypothetical protein